MHGIECNVAVSVAGKQVELASGGSGSQGRVRGDGTEGEVRKYEGRVLAEDLAKVGCGDGGGRSHCRSSSQ